MIFNPADLMVTLLGVSIVTGLLTQGVKVVLDELNISYKSNILAGIVSVLVGLFTFVLSQDGIEWTFSMVISLIAFIVASWLCAMLGYDKVVQTLTQVKSIESEDE